MSDACRISAAGMPAAEARAGGRGTGWKPVERVDVQPRDQLGRLGGDLLDLHPARRRQHQQRPLRAAVERDREVVLALDVRGALDPDPPDDVPADVHAQDVARASASASAGSAAYLMPPALPRPPTSTCAFTMTGAAEPLGRRARLLRRVGDLAVGDGDPEPAEELLALILVQVHRPRESTRAGRLLTATMQAGLPVLVNFACLRIANNNPTIPEQFRSRIVIGRCDRTCPHFAATCLLRRPVRGSSGFKEPEARESAVRPHRRG